MTSTAYQALTRSTHLPYHVGVEHANSSAAALAAVCENTTMASTPTFVEHAITAQQLRERERHAETLCRTARGAGLEKLVERLTSSAFDATSSDPHNYAYIRELRGPLTAAAVERLTWYLTQPGNSDVSRHIAIAAVVERDCEHGASLYELVEHAQIATRVRYVLRHQLDTGDGAALLVGNGELSRRDGDYAALRALAHINAAMARQYADRLSVPTTATAQLQVLATWAALGVWNTTSGAGQRFADLSEMCAHTQWHKRSTTRGTLRGARAALTALHAASLEPSAPPWVHTSIENVCERWGSIVGHYRADITTPLTITTADIIAALDGTSGTGPLATPAAVREDGTGHYNTPSSDETLIEARLGRCPARWRTALELAAGSELALVDVCNTAAVAHT